MAFCCCKKSKPAKQNETIEIQTSLLHAEEEHDQPTVSSTKPEPLVAVKLTGEVDLGGRGATGVAKLPGRIYILCKHPPSILIYRDEPPFDRIDEVSLEGVAEAPHDLASSIKSSCLYLTDGAKNTVCKMTTPSHEVTPWLDEIDYPHTLTVTSPDDQVLIVRFGSPSGLEIYGPDAVQVRRIQIPDEIEYPKHAVRTSGGNYIVSGKAKGSAAWGVFEVNAEGELVRSTTQDNHLTELYHLAIDSADRVIVADCWQNRVLVFDPELTRNQELLPNDGKGKQRKWPWRLHYEASGKQVLVLHHDGRVGRGKCIADGGKDEAEGKTKEGYDGATAEEKKTSKSIEDTEKEKTKEEEKEDKTQNGRGKETEKVTVEENEADKEEDEEKSLANGTETEKTDAEQKKKGEEKEDEKEDEQEKNSAIVYIYSFI